MPLLGVLGSAAVLTILAIGEVRAAGPAISLASDGHAALPVVVGAQATPRVRKIAESLAQYLGRISDGTFAVQPGDGLSGIAVGLPADFPKVAVPSTWGAKDPTRREDCVLRSHPQGLYVLGATELGVEHAVWDLLHRLGYRQFFPGPTWEVIPHERKLSIAVDVEEHPAYYGRRIWYGYGTWDYNAGPYADWCARNRATSGIVLSSGHAYEGFLHKHKAEFAAHPEYLGLVGGKRTSSKFCISNPGLRKLVIDDVLAHMAKDPANDSVSVEPSDGGGWCECEACAKLGSISDRAVFLANEVATALHDKYPNTLVGMYAYNYHSPAPNISAHPQVIIGVATAFIKGGQTLDDLLQGWSAKARMIGIREYYSIHPWDHDLPGAARAANPAYLARTIPEFHAKGARFMSAESSDNWGPNGLGFYLAARMLWDVAEAKQVAELTDDFLARAFGPAKEPMREFYRQIDGSQPHLVAADQLGRMFRALDEARHAASDPAIQARLTDLLLYARYVDLHRRYASAAGAARQQAFEALLRHGYRMRTTMMIHAKALYRDLPHRDKAVQVPDGCDWRIAEGKNPWKSSQPFTAEEVGSYLSEGIARYPLAKFEFKPVEFSHELVDTARLKFPETPAGSLGAGRGRQTFYTRVASAPARLELAITGGLIAHYRDRGNVRIELWKLGGASQTGERETLAAEDRSVPPDGNRHEVALAVKEPGLYRLTISDGNDRTLVEWKAGQSMVVRSTVDEPMNQHYTDLWQMYFYVPKGTKVLGLFGGEHGEVRDSAGRAVFLLNGRDPNFYSVDVPDGQDGKLWQIRYGRGPIRLLTVPPCFARSAAELLLPREVVEKDAS